MSTNRQSDHAAEVVYEQGYADWAYACLERMLAHSAALEPPNSAKTGPAMQRHKAAVAAKRDDAGGELIVGRMDFVDGETLYVGKTHVDGDNRHDVAVMDWRADMGGLFYQANRSDPQGVGRRRTIRMRDKRVRDLSDDILTTGFQPPRATPSVVRAPKVAPRPKLDRPKVEVTPEPEVEAIAQPATLTTDAEVDLRAGDLVLAEMAEERTGRMREVVATIQADQDRLVRAPLDGVLVVQGAPGTGKTVVGLHRAAYVLYKQRESNLPNSVLVVGPNPAFLSYIQDVLPSLGEDTATQITLSELPLLDLPAPERARIEVRSHDSESAATIKGDLRIAEVVRRAAWLLTRPQRVVVSHGRVTVTLDEDAVEALLVRMEREAVSMRSARNRLRSLMQSAVAEQYATRLGRDVADRTIASDLRQLNERLQDEVLTPRYLEGTIPDLNPRVVIERLLTDPGLLAVSSEGILSPTQQADILRPRPRSGAFPWSRSDLPLVGEAAFVIGDRTRSFSHIVIDEAQDLTPMQWRMLLRRSGRRSMTILGDLAQATGTHPPKSWPELMKSLGLGSSSTLVELGVGYRVPRQIIEFASRLLPAAAPEVSMPLSVRDGPEPVLRRVPPSQLAEALVDIVAGETRGQTAIVVPSSRRDEIRAVLEHRAVKFAEAAKDGITSRVLLLSPDDAKGLEFDHVIVVEPRTIAGRTRRGLRYLFVSLTRSTRHLTILHAEPLPKALLTQTAATSPREHGASR